MSGIFLICRKSWEKRGKIIFARILIFLSTGSLLKTLLTPWHGLMWSYGRGFSFTRYAETIISNGFSRIIGAIIRIFLIIFGFVVEVFIFILGGIVFFTWLFLPVLLVVGFVFSIKLLF